MIALNCHVYQFTLPIIPYNYHKFPQLLASTVEGCLFEDWDQAPRHTPIPLPRYFLTTWWSHYKHIHPNFNLIIFQEMINIIALNKFFVLSTCNRLTEERQTPILHSIFCRPGRAHCRLITPYNIYLHTFFSFVIILWVARMLK